MAVLTFDTAVAVLAFTFVASVGVATWARVEGPETCESSASTSAGFFNETDALILADTIIEK